MNTAADNTNTTGTKYVQAIVSTETHKQLKILAMEKELSLQDMLRINLEELVKTKEKEKKDG